MALALSNRSPYVNLAVPCSGPRICAVQWELVAVLHVDVGRRLVAGTREPKRKRSEVAAQTPLCVAYLSRIVSTPVVGMTESVLARLVADARCSDCRRMSTAAAPLLVPHDGVFYA